MTSSLAEMSVDPDITLTNDSSSIDKHQETGEDEAGAGPILDHWKRKEAMTKVYKVKEGLKPLMGNLYLDMNGFGSGYMGRDETLNEGEGYPVYTFGASIKYFDINKEEFQAEEKKKETGESIGSISGHVVQCGRATNGGHGFLETMDVLSEELLQIAVLLYDEDGMMKDDDHWEMTGDILHIEDIYIKPEFRGYGIGLLAIDHLIKQLPSSQATVVFLSPCPPSCLRGERKKEDDDPLNMEVFNKEDMDEAIKKLGEYYSLIDFRKLTTPEQKKKHFQGLDIWGLWTGYKLRDIKKIVPHLFE